MKAALALLAFAAAFLAALAIGATDHSLGDLVEILRALARGAPLDDRLDTARTILFSIRLPRVVVAALAGAALAAAGVLSQGLLRESLASPSVMGSEAGAALAAAVVFHLGAAYLHWLLLPAAAFAGALGATSLLFLLARRRGAATPLATLLLAGFALNTLLSALTSLFLSFLLEDVQKSSAAMHWLLGGFGGKGWEHAATMLPPLVLGLGLAAGLTARLDVLALGEEVAASLSVTLPSLRRATFAAIALLVGAAAAVSGAVPFVGLVVPHITRRLTGPRHGPLLALSAVNGATLMLVADLVARTVRAPRELEVGVLTSLLGAPFFLWLLVAKRRGAEGA